MGMQSVYRALEDSISVNIGTVVLKDDDIQISEVTITGKLQEVVMEGDTTVINAAACQHKLHQLSNRQRNFCKIFLHK